VAITAERFRSVEATFGIGANSHRASGTTSGRPRLWGEAAGNVTNSTEARQFNQKKAHPTIQDGQIKPERQLFTKTIKR
jgi:hypothetical protein